VVYDRPALAETRKELESINDSLEDAAKRNDKALIQYYTNEKEGILEVVRKATGKRGQSRIMGTDSTRAFGAVRKGIERAILAISRIDRPSSEFLSRYIQLANLKLCYIGPQVEWRFL
jgi:hypothetical protein